MATTSQFIIGSFSFTTALLALTIAIGGCKPTLPSPGTSAADQQKTENASGDREILPAGAEKPKDGDYYSGKTMVSKFNFVNCPGKKVQIGKPGLTPLSTGKIELGQIIKGKIGYKKDHYYQISIGDRRARDELLLIAEIGEGRSPDGPILAYSAKFSFEDGNDYYYGVKPSTGQETFNYHYIRGWNSLLPGEDLKETTLSLKVSSLSLDPGYEADYFFMFAGKEHSIPSPYLVGCDSTKNLRIGEKLVVARGKGVTGIVKLTPGTYKMSLSDQLLEAKITNKTGLGGLKSDDPNDLEWVASNDIIAPGANHVDFTDQVTFQITESSTYYVLVGNSQSGDDGWVQISRVK